MEREQAQLWSRLSESNMLRRLIEEHFDGVFLIECATGQIWELGEEFSAELRVDGESMNGRQYDQQLRRSMERHVKDETERELLLERLSLERVMAMLEEQEVYTVDLNAWHKGGGYPACKRFMFHYVDDHRAMIAMTCEDATANLLSETDPLTGMMNSVGFHRRVQQWIDTHPGRRFRIQRYNVDRFRDINGLYGRDVGDKLLRDLGRHMMSYDQGEDCFSAHLNADHFARFCAEGTMSLQECYNNFNSCFEHYDLSIAVTLHIGVYDLCEPDCDASTMSYKALLALQSIKGSQTRRIAYYEKGMLDEEREQGELLRDLSKAVANDEFEIWFQPQVDYQRHTLLGAEALVRWRHPTRGLLMPGTFVPLLEKSDNVHQLDRWVLRRTCGYIQRWRELMPGRHITVSVNLSREDLDRPGLCDKLDALLERAGVPREALHLEVTESAYVEDTQRVLKAVDEFRSRGFIVEMDDFGSGYSSLNALKDIDIDKLKLDMRFLAGDDSAKGRVILRYVIGMAKELQLPIIAEGVETKEQADMLMDYGCREMQGYYFSRPVPAEAYEKLLSGETRIEALAE